jgi:hypothetical protein
MRRAAEAASRRKQLAVKEEKQEGSEDVALGVDKSAKMGPVADCHGRTEVELLLLGQSMSVANTSHSKIGDHSWHVMSAFMP